MDLSSFTSKKEKLAKELIFSKDKTEIYCEDGELVFKTDNKETLELFSKVLFFAPTQSILVHSEEELNEFFALSKKEGVEGLMLKSLNAVYKAGLRTGAMAKLKETMEDLDLVILAAQYGKGKRSGFYSSFFLGVLDESQEEETYLYLGKVSSGVKELGDEGISLTKLQELLEPLKVKEEKETVFFEAKVIVQVKYQEIQTSTSYDSGFALRFPRLIALREDKNLEEIATLSDVKKYFKSQLV